MQKKKLNYFILIKHENLKESIASYTAEMSFVPQFQSSYNGVIRYFPGEKHSGKFSFLRNKPPCLHHCLSYHKIIAENCWDLKQGMKLAFFFYPFKKLWWVAFTYLLVNMPILQGFLRIEGLKPCLIYSIATATFLASTTLLGLQVCAGIPGMMSL